MQTDWEFAFSAMSNDTTAVIEQCIRQLQLGNIAARDRLISCTCERLRRIADKMTNQFPALQRFEQSDDVLQNAVMRLSRSLERITPRTAREFFGLASLEIRRELIDLMRHYYGPMGIGANIAALPTNDTDGVSNPAFDIPDSTNEPVKLSVWSEFHRHVELLDDEDREIFDLLWYQDLTQSEAAVLLGVSERTVKRRWQRARLAVHARLNGRPLDRQ